MEKTKITVIPNGPVVIQGKIEITKLSGEKIKDTEKISLCRCGHAADKLFCDGSHKKVNFKAE